MIGDDERAQSIQVGAVLLFGALIIALSAYQAFVVPQQNEKVEFTHNQEVQNQLADLRNAVASVPGDSTTQSVSVTLGTSYPERLIALNPGPPSGALRTRGTTDPAINLSIENATAVTESDEVADLWNGTRLNYSTGALEYRPNYNVYGSAPTTYYENSVLFNQFDSGEVTLTDQRLVDGNTISLVTLNGSIDRTQQGSTSVDVEPLSASTTTVTVQNESLTEPLTLRVPTRISADTWETDLLADEEHVADVYPAGDLPGSELQLVAIELDPRESYRLRMAKAGVGSATEGESRSYVTDVRGDGEAVPAGGRTDVVVEVRDRFNNPISGVTLEASTNDTAATLSDTDETTGSDGRATFTVRAGSGVSSSTPVAVNVSYDVTPAVVGADFDESGLANVTAVVYAGQGGSGGDGSAHDYVVDWRDYGVVPGSAVNPATECSAIPCPEAFDVASIANPPDPGKVVTYYVNNSTAATISPSYGSTNSSGQHVTSLAVTGQTDVNLSASNTTGADTILLDTVFESTFEDGPGAWRSFGTFAGDDPGTSGFYANRGQQSIRIDGGNPGGIVTDETYDTVDAELLTVEYWARADGPGDGEDLVVEYLQQGGNPNVEGDWIEVDRLAGDEATTFERRARIAADDARHLSFQLRFRQVGADSVTDEWFVDDVIFRTYGPAATSGSGSGDQPPTADAGGPYAVDEGGSTTLDGTGSTDDGTVQDYSWTKTSGPGTLTSPNSAQPGYNAPDDVSGDQTVLFELTVTDDAGQTDTASTSLTVRDTNAAPSVTVREPNGGEQLASGSTFTIDWSASDPDGDLTPNSADLEYSTDGGSTWSNIVSGQSTTGTYDWTVDDADTTDARVRVSVDDDADNTGRDSSDSAFTIDGSAPTISGPSISDQTDGNGEVGNGDTVRVTATVSDSASGVASVSVDASAFGAGTVPLSDAGDGTWDGTFTVGSSGTPTEGDQSVTATATDGVDNSDSATTGTLTVDTTPPTFSRTRAPSLVPFSDGQYQEFTVTLESDLPEAESVTITLDDAQGTTPLQVDYGSSIFTVNVSVDNANAVQNSDTASYTFSPASDLPAGTTIAVEASNIVVGDVSDQTGPYTVTVDRTDGTPVSDSFDVAYDSGTAELESLSASDLAAGQSGQTQTIRFAPTTDLDPDERVVIDLSDPQSPTRVQYGSASATLVTGSGAIQNFVAAGESSEVTTVVYRAPAGGLAADTTVEIELSGVATASQATSASPYTVGFSRETTDTASTTFAVSPVFREIIDDFDGGQSLGANPNWTAVGENPGEVFVDEDAATARSDPGAVNIADIGSDGGIESRSMDTRGLSEVSVSASVREGDPDGDEPNSGEDLVFEYRNDAGTWVEVQRAAATGSQQPYDHYSATITNADAFHDDFAVRIVQVSTNSNPDNWFVDDVCVVSGSGSCPFPTDVTPPSISSVSLAGDGSGNMDLSLESDELLDTITVTVDGPNGATYTFDESDFSASGTGPFTYDLTTTQAFDDGDGTYTATVDAAVDSSGNNGGENGAGSGLSDSYTYSSGPPTTQNGIRYDGNLGSTGSNSAVQFDISNVDSSFARIEGVRVSVQNGVSGSIFNGGSNEIDISGGDSDGFRYQEDKNPSSRALAADGTSIDLDQNAVLSTSGGGTSATVFVGQFGSSQGNTFNQYDFGTLSRVSSSDDWDVSITLEFQNRGDVTFYFDES